MTTYSVNKGWTVPTVSGSAGTWGTILNSNTFAAIDNNLGGIVSLSLSSSNVTLSASQTEALIIRCSGTLSANVQITLTPEAGSGITYASGFWTIHNNTTGNYLLTVTNGVGAVALIPQGISTVVHADPTNGVFIAGARNSTVGQVAPFIGSTVPGGWLKANGALVSRTSYAALWTYAQASGTIVTDANWTSSKAYGCFSTGDTSTTFRLPDLREYFLIGWADDKTGGIDDSRGCGIFQDQSLLGHTHTATSGNDTPDHTHTTTAYGGIAYSSGPLAYASGFTSSNNTGGASVRHTHPITVNASSANTRNVPQNVALMYCISYL